jgi:hypothetical protein
MVDHFALSLSEVRQSELLKRYLEVYVRYASHALSVKAPLVPS